MTTIAERIIGARAERIDKSDVNQFDVDQARQDIITSLTHLKKAQKFLNQGEAAIAGRTGQVVGALTNIDLYKGYLNIGSEYYPLHRMLNDAWKKLGKVKIKR